MLGALYEGVSIFIFRTGSKPNRFSRFDFGSSTKWIDFGIMHQESMDFVLILNTTFRINSEFDSSKFHLFLTSTWIRSLNTKFQKYHVKISSFIGSFFPLVSNQNKLYYIYIIVYIHMILWNIIISRFCPKKKKNLFHSLTTHP